MKIRNEGKRTFFFNGGKIAPGEVVDIRNETIAKALLGSYSKELICLDDLKVTVVESPKEEPVEEEKVEEPVADKKPAPKKTGKKKKA